MVADGCGDRQGADPLIFCCFRIVIINASAGGIPAVKRVSCRIISGGGNRLIDLSVNNGGKGSVLVDYAGERVGERGMFDPVQNNGADGNLTGIRFSPRFGGNDSC